MDIYIDKTEYIERLENFDSPYITFLRPRCFGKSLFTSVLANYYDINEKDNFKKLFEETYIAKKGTKEKNSYCILKFNFTGLNTDTKEELEKTLNKLSNRDYIKFDEKYIKLIFLAYCFLSKIYLVKSEYEVDNGYIDIVLLKQANREPDYFAIFELKYITKAEYEKEGEKIVEEKKNEALEQIEKYKYSDELMALPNLKKWAVVFVNDRCVANVER